MPRSVPGEDLPAGRREQQDVVGVPPRALLHAGRADRHARHGEAGRPGAEREQPAGVWDRSVIEAAVVQATREQGAVPSRSAATDASAPVLASPVVHAAVGAGRGSAA